jgi:hypothetical protein
LVSNTGQWRKLGNETSVATGGPLGVDGLLDLRPYDRRRRLAFIRHAAHIRLDDRETKRNETSERYRTGSASRSPLIITHFSLKVVTEIKPSAFFIRDKLRDSVRLTVA